MENLSVSPSRFDDVGIILNGNNCFVGLETPDGVEACTLDKPFVLNKKVLSRYDEACNYIKKILPVKMKIELPRGYRLTLTPDDLAVFFSQKCDMSAMRDYIEERKTRTEAETRRWLAERPWDTMPVSGAEAEAQNAQNRKHGGAAELGEFVHQRFGHSLKHVLQRAYSGEDHSNV